MKLTKSEAWPVAGQAFPDYQGRKFRISLAGRVTFYDTNWGGGTRNQYRAVELSIGGRCNDLPVPAPWYNVVEGKTVDIPQGWAVVEHSIFQGHDMGLTVHISTLDLPRLLPNGIIEGVKS